MTMTQIDNQNKTKENMFKINNFKLNEIKTCKNYNRELHFFSFLTKFFNDIRIFLFWISITDCNI